MPEDFIKRYSQETQMLMSGTYVFHEGLQKKAALFHILFWEMRNIDITRRALSAWNRAFQRSSSDNTCTEVPDYTSLFSRLLSPLLPLSVCLCVWNGETHKKTQRNPKYHTVYPDASFILSAIHTLRLRALPPAANYTLWPVTVVDRTGHV